MNVMLQDLNRGVFAPGRGSPSLAACSTSIQNGGFYGPFVDVEGWYSPVPAKTRMERANDLKLKVELDLVNAEIIQRGLQAAGKRLFPYAAKDIIAKTLDKCLKEEETLVI